MHPADLCVREFPGLPRPSLRRQTLAAHCAGAAACIGSRTDSFLIRATCYAFGNIIPSMLRCMPFAARVPLVFPLSNVLGTACHTYTAACATSAREPTSYASDGSDMDLSSLTSAQQRRLRLLETASSWPAAIPPAELFSHMTTYKSYFSDALKPPFLCATCACPTSFPAAELLNLREVFPDLMVLHSFFSANTYMQRYYEFHGCNLPPTFTGLQIETLQSYLATLPIELRTHEPAPRQFLLLASISMRSFFSFAWYDPSCFNFFFPVQDAWLLHFSNQSSWSEAAADSTAPLFLICCQHCAPFLRSMPPSIPPRSLANNNLCIGPPPELQNLSLGEQLFIARGHALRRLRTLSHTGDPAARQTGLLGTTSAIAFPQDPVSILSSLPPTPESLCDYISVFFPNEAETDLRYCKEFIIRRNVVHAALRWLLHHNPYYCDLHINVSALHTLPEDAVPLPWLEHAQATNRPADASSTFDHATAN